MMIRVLRFNIYLLLGLMIGIAPGCKSSKPKDPNKYSKKDEASLRLYLEVNPDGSESNGPISVGRQSPFELNVQKTPFLTEFQIEKAAVVDGLGGYSISVQFNNQGSMLLEQYTTGSKGKHMAISAEFGQLRWIAAPVITKRIGDGLLVFTPDTSREEAERIVSGLNRVAELVRKGRK
jgi:preprotein translocase subunit SecD